MVNNFEQSVDTILEDVSVTIIFQCSKNYGTPTRVTRKSCTKYGRLYQSHRKLTVALKKVLSLCFTGVWGVCVTATCLKG